jgi:hypothetical protein
MSDENRRFVRNLTDVPALVEDIIADIERTHGGPTAGCCDWRLHVNRFAVFSAEAKYRPPSPVWVVVDAANLAALPFQQPDRLPDILALGDKTVSLDPIADDLTIGCLSGNNLARPATWPPYGLRRRL